MTVIWRHRAKSVVCRVFGKRVCSRPCGSVKPSRQWTKSVELSITTYSIVGRFRRANFSETITPDFTLRTWKALSDCRPTQARKSRLYSTRDRACNNTICASLDTINHRCFFDMRLRDILCTTCARVFYSRCPWPGTHFPAGDTRPT